MQMVKQEPGSNQCGLCTVAMLIDRTREEMLAAVPDYEGKADYFWLNHMHALGFKLEDVPPQREEKRLADQKIRLPRSAIMEVLSRRTAKAIFQQLSAVPHSPLRDLLSNPDEPRIID
jgi:hypothetical protein